MNLIKKILFTLVFSYLSADCPFCNEELLNRQKFYEDDLVIALYTHEPVLPSHFLIIPKRHVERLDNLSDAEMIQIFHTIKQVNQAAQKVFGTSAYLIHQKNGHEAGQTVPHVHFHLISKQPGDSSEFKFATNLIVNRIRGPISQEKMQPIITSMHAAMNEVVVNKADSLHECVDDCGADKGHPPFLEVLCES